MSEQTRVRDRIMVVALAALAVLSLALLTTQKAQANVRFDNDGEVPFYARFEPGEVFHTDDWAVIVFYRPPGCIPPDFNLLDFFHFPDPVLGDPGAFGCGPPSTDGFEVWKNGPGDDMAPIQSQLHGLGAVPVWFVDWSELEFAMGDDSVTISELGSLPSLKTGSAVHFHEVLHPSQAANNPMINYTASGSLDDGGFFWVHAMGNTASGRVSVQIEMDN